MVTPARSVPDAQPHRFIKYQPVKDITCLSSLRSISGSLPVSSQLKSFLARNSLPESRQSRSCGVMHSSQSAR